MRTRQLLTVTSSVFIGGLIRKRQKLESRRQSELTPEDFIDIRSIDITLRLYSPAFDPRPKTHHGDAVHADDLVLLRMIRLADEGTTVWKLAIAILSANDLPVNDLRIVRRVAIGVNAAVHRLADEGEVLIFHTGTSAPVCTLSALGHQRLEGGA